MKHNPGPLRVEYNLDGRAVCIRCEPDEQNAGTHVADMLSSRSPEETKANAILFAAAPELLDALKAILARLNGEWDNPALTKIGPLSTEGADIEFIARAAIVKAKGELP